MITIKEADYNDVLIIRREVMYPDKSIEFVKLPEDETGIHLGAFENNEIGAVMSIFMGANRSVQFRKLATCKHLQRKGYATSLMNWLLDYATDVKLTRLWCNARIEAIGFYTKFGFRETGETMVRDCISYAIVEKAF